MAICRHTFVLQILKIRNMKQSKRNIFFGGQNFFKMKNKLCAFYLGTIFLVIISAQFSFSQWVTNGPYGGVINSLTTSGGKVFAGTGNGVFISSDNGQSWSIGNTGIDRKQVAAFAVNGSNLFAGIYY